jgi:hypothetical protein
MSDTERPYQIKPELDELEQHGFVYLVSDGKNAEVRLP